VLRGLHARLSYANVTATLALFFALGGGAYAAATINSGDVVNNSLKSVDLMNDAAVKTGDVVNDAVTGGGLTDDDLRPGSVGSSEVVNNSLGGGDVNERKLLGTARRIEFAPSGCGGAFATPSTGCQDEVLEFAGLALTATCYFTNDSGGTQWLRLDATTPEDAHTSWHYQASNGASPEGEAFGGVGPFMVFNAGTTQFEFEQGTLIYRKPGTVISVDFHGGEQEPAAEQSCRFFGTALRGA
jgi:hypothetical protein